MLATKRSHFLADIFAIPRREKLTLFYIHRSSGFRAGLQQITLATQERRYLQKIYILCSILRLLLSVHVRHDRHIQFFTDVSQDTASLLHARSAEAGNTSAVGFIIRCFEDELDTEACAYFFDISRHAVRKFLLLKRARP